MSERVFRRYERSASLYDDYIPHADYAQAVDKARSMITRLHPGASTLLDVGCGSGRHLEHLQRHYACEGLDLAPGFLDVAKRRCPDLTFHLADMTSFDLGKTFDVITCLFAAISYVGTIDRLDAAVACMQRHLNPGGLLLVEPWLWPDKFRQGRLAADFVDRPDLKISRMFIASVEDNVSIYDIHYMVGTPNGIEYFVEREDLGLFTHAQYTEAFVRAGLEVEYDATGGLFPDHNIGMYRGRNQLAQSAVCE